MSDLAKNVHRDPLWTEEVVDDPTQPAKGPVFRTDQPTGEQLFGERERSEDADIRWHNAMRDWELRQAEDREQRKHDSQMEYTKMIREEQLELVLQQRELVVTLLSVMPDLVDSGANRSAIRVRQAINIVKAVSEAFPLREV